MGIQRKDLKRFMLVNWAKYQAESARVEGSALVAGRNAAGKTMILDALIYLLTGSRKFNASAGDKERTVVGYVRGDTKAKGEGRYIRKGEITSYILAEFWSPIDRENVTVGVCIESKAENESPSSKWFVCRNTTIDDFNVYRKEEGKLYVTPRNELAVRGNRLKAMDFMNPGIGLEQTLRSLGIRTTNVSGYTNKLLKMVSIKNISSIDDFISKEVLEKRPVGSLDEIRAQREKFDQIKAQLADLQEGKKILEHMEILNKDYESELSKLHFRQVKYAYQGWRIAGDDLKENERVINENKALMTKWTDAFEVAEKELEECSRRLQKIDSDAGFQGIKGSIEDKEKQLVESKAMLKNLERQYYKLKDLRKNLLHIIEAEIEGFDISNEEKHIVKTIAESGTDHDAQFRTFMNLGEKSGKVLEYLRRKHYRTVDDREELESEQTKLELQKKSLESNKIMYPDWALKGKEAIINEFKKEGIKTDVRFFAELVTEFKDLSWRNSIEAFLGNKRYNIIIDEKYCKKAMEILQKRKITGTHIVITDKLPKTEPKPGTAADVLVIPNTHARLYANYLLNGIYLCNDIDELHNHPLGGITNDGMLAKGYTVSVMDFSRLKVCMGQDIVRIQLEQTIESLKLVGHKIKNMFERERQLTGHIKMINEMDFNPESYSFEALDQLKKKQKECATVESDLKTIKADESFIQILALRDRTMKEYEQKRNESYQISNQISNCKHEISRRTDDIENLNRNVNTKKTDYDAVCSKHLEYKKAAEEEYEKDRAKEKKSIIVTERTLQDRSLEVERAKNAVIECQNRYCRTTGSDFSKVGIAYIPYYREKYRDIANVKIEEANKKLEEQAKKLEETFMSDFIAEINEYIRDAKAELDALNRELKTVPFGSDIYRFRMEEKPERKAFFRISEQLQNHMNSSEFLLGSSYKDEALEEDIRYLMDTVLNEEDEEEYTDYRRYFTYDMNIFRKEGEQNTEYDLSTKQGSASNGEKHTPYYIILAASLMQYYPKDACCARLLFIDEAFSVLSPERIEQMVKYFTANGFQVIYAAPPDRINTIGSYVDTNISLVQKGKHTKIIEGLIEFID